MGSPIGYNEKVQEDVKTKPSLFGLTTAEIRARLAEMGLPAFRGSQVAEWLYRRILLGADGGFQADFLAVVRTAAEDFHQRSKDVR